MDPTYNNFLQALIPQPRLYQLFISHSWDYGQDRTSLGDLILKGLGTKYVYDSSAPKDDPIHATNDDTLVQALIERITRAEVLVFPDGVYASYSRWIPIELAIANALNKPVIAVEKWGSKRSTTMINSATEVVGWSSKSVADAINRLHPVRYAPPGSSI